VWQVGKPVSVADDEPTLGWVTPDGPAWKAGLRPGDRIIAINGQPVNHFGPPSQESIVWRVITSGGTNIALTYVRAGATNTANAVPFKRETKWYERRALREISVEPTSEAKVGGVITNSPADRAGVKSGDVVLALDGQPIYSIRAVEHVSRQMTNAGAKPVEFTLQRGADEVKISMLAERPDSPTNFPAMFGIAWMPTTNRTLAYPGPWQQITDSGRQIFATIGAVISKHTDIGAQQLGGAVMIIRVYTNFFQSEDGWRWVLWFSVVLNVNLALLNMLPLPVLDGGHILLSLIEIIRRRAVSPRLLNHIQSGFALLLISFMLWIAFYDIGDWVRSGRRGGRNPPIIFNPR
jgi:regulator of sigma E protease